MIIDLWSMIQVKLNNRILLTYSQQLPYDPICPSVGRSIGPSVCAFSFQNIQSYRLDILKVSSTSNAPIGAIVLINIKLQRKNCSFLLMATC